MTELTVWAWTPARSGDEDHPMPGTRCSCAPADAPSRNGQPSMTATETRSSPQPRQTHSGPPLGRHAAAVAMTIGLLLVFGWVNYPKAEAPLPLEHTVYAHASLVLLCLVLILGPAARLVPRLKRLVPWRRELGIAMFVTASLHVALLNDFSLDLTGFFGEHSAPSGEYGTRVNDYLFATSMSAAANWAGLIALGAAMVLAATSNDWSQRRLGRGWKFVHQQAYTVFVLTWLHIAAFVLLRSGGMYHQPRLSASLLWGITLAVVLAQFVGFVRTVRARRASAPSPRSNKIVDVESAGPQRQTLRWAGVVALWSAVVLSAWLPTVPPTEEERQIAALCARYDELRDRPFKEIRAELAELAPSDDQGAYVEEWLTFCDEL